jgi:hypothetical protein
VAAAKVGWLVGVAAGWLRSWAWMVGYVMDSQISA